MNTKAGRTECKGCGTAGLNAATLAELPEVCGRGEAVLVGGRCVPCHGEGEVADAVRAEARRQRFGAPSRGCAARKAWLAGSKAGR